MYNTKPLGSSVVRVFHLTRISCRDGKWYMGKEESCLREGKTALEPGFLFSNDSLYLLDSVQSLILKKKFVCVCVGGNPTSVSQWFCVDL